MPERPEEAKKKRPAWLVWAVAGALFVGGLAAAFLLLGGGDDTTEAGGLDADLVLQLQTLCFEGGPPLFYDDQGYCYPVEPNTLSSDALIAARVLPNSAAPAGDEAADDEAAGADLSASGSVTPAAPAAPAAPSSGTPVSPAAPAPAQPSGTPAAPTATNTTSTTTSTTTTEAPLPPINIGSSGWRWNLSFPTSIDGVDCVMDADGKYPSGCQDAINGNYTVNFGVTDGAVSGSQTIPGLGSKTATFSGSISPSGGVATNVKVGSSGTGVSTEP